MSVRGWTRRTIGGAPVWVHPTGAKIERLRPRSRMHDAKWRAFWPDGSPVRVTKNADGSDYVPRPWHGPKELPAVRYFPDAPLAARVIEGYLK